MGKRGLILILFLLTSFVLISACSNKEGEGQEQVTIGEMNKLSEQSINEYVFEHITDVKLDEVYTLDDTDYLVYIYSKDGDSFSDSNRTLYMYLKNKTPLDIYGVDITDYDLHDYIEMIDTTKTLHTQTLFYVQEVEENEDLVKRVVPWKVHGLEVGAYKTIPEPVMVFEFDVQ